MEPPQHIRARIRMQGAPSLFSIREAHFRALAFHFAIQAEIYREALGHVHEVPPRHEAYDHVGPDLAEGPGFAGAGAGEDVVLGVVEDVAGVGFGDSGVGFAEGWVEGDGGVEFDAVGLEVGQ